MVMHTLAEIGKKDMRDKFYLHPRVHLDGSCAQWDAKRARLYCVIVVRCYSAVAVLFSKQINMRNAVILKIGEKHSDYQQRSSLNQPLQKNQTFFNKLSLILSVL